MSEYNTLNYSDSHCYCQSPEGYGDVQCLSGFLKTQIGKRVQVSFLIGNMLTDRQGTLASVGINYIVLRDIETDDIIACTSESIRFVRIYH